jgi:uncharacterized cupin superfamily protein
MPAMPAPDRPVALEAGAIAPRATSSYPAPFQPRVQGRVKRALGDAFGLTHFGVNLTRLAPGAASALRHGHSRQEEFIYILEGRPTLITNAGTHELAPGMCAGFPAATGDAHHLVNRGNDDVLYLEVGDRIAGDAVEYPDDDVRATPGEGGLWVFTHKDGTAY